MYRSKWQRFIRGGSVAVLIVFCLQLVYTLSKRDIERQVRAAYPDEARSGTLWVSLEIAWPSPTYGIVCDWDVHHRFGLGAMAMWRMLPSREVTFHCW